MSKEENFKLFCELRGQEVEYTNYLGKWAKGTLVSWHEDHDACFGIGDSIGEIVTTEIRPIKKPEYKPWTYQTISASYVRDKSWRKGFYVSVLSIHDDKIIVLNGGEFTHVFYTDLLEDWETRDGGVCGEVVGDE